MEAVGNSLDKIDRKIISCLLQDAALSNAELSDRVGLTAAPLSRRLARLYASGIIKQRVVIDAPSVGLGLQAYVEITLDRTTPQGSVSSSMSASSTRWWKSMPSPVTSISS